MANIHQVDTIIGDLLNHQITRQEAVSRIEAVYEPGEKPKQHTSQRPELHWVDCSKKGKVDVFHVYDCEGGETCKLIAYLNDHMEKHLKRGRQYEAYKAKGQWVFEDAGLSDDAKPKGGPTE